MATEPIILNFQLASASHAKYVMSGLHPTTLSPNQKGRIEDAPLQSLGAGTPYPLVSDTDLYGRDFIVPLTIKWKEVEMHFPEAVVNRKLLDTPDRLDIVSDFLTLFDLDGGDFGIVVESYSVKQDTHLNRQIFEIQAVSDYDYNLLIEQ